MVKRTNQPRKPKLAKRRHVACVAAGPPAGSSSRLKPNAPWAAIASSWPQRRVNAPAAAVRWLAGPAAVFPLKILSLCRPPPANLQAKHGKPALASSGELQVGCPPLPPLGFAEGFARLDVIAGPANSVPLHKRRQRDINGEPPKAGGQFATTSIWRLSHSGTLRLRSRRKAFFSAFFFLPRLLLQATYIPAAPGCA